MLINTQELMNIRVRVRLRELSVDFSELPRGREVGSLHDHGSYVVS